MKIGPSLGVSFQTGTTVEAFIETAAQKNYPFVEVIAEPPFCFMGDFNRKRKKAIRELLESHNIELAIHASFSSVNIASLNENIRRKFVSEIKLNLDFAHELGATILVLHPGDLGAFGKQYSIKVEKQQLQSLTEITQYAEKLGSTKVGLENMPICTWTQLDGLTTPEWTAEKVNAIGSPFLGITWDVGHSHTTEIPMEAFAEAFTPKLFHLHVHDNQGPTDGWRDTHLEIGQGTFDWKKLLELLKEQKFDRTVAMELHSWEIIDRSIKYLRAVGF